MGEISLKTVSYPVAGQARLFQEASPYIVVTVLPGGQGGGNPETRPQECAATAHDRRSTRLGD